MKDLFNKILNYKYSKCVLRLIIIFALPISSISAQYLCQYDNLSLYNTGTTKIEWGKLAYLYKCATGHSFWIVSNYGSYSVNLNEFDVSNSKDKIRKATDSESAIVKSTNFISAFVNATNNTKEKMSLGYKGDVLKGITTRQIPGASRMFKKCVPSVVLLFSVDGYSLGSGTIISKNGEIVTNWHVVEGQEKMLVWFYKKGLSDLKDLDPDNYAVAEVIATDQKRDLALLKLTDNNQKIKLNPVKFGRYYNLEVAQDVFAIGHPEALAWSFTYGVISALRKDYSWQYSEEIELIADVIQTQTPTNPGNSGGPLFDEKGKLIGINSFGSEGSDGLNFAVSVDELKSFLSEARAGKHKPIITETVATTYQYEDCTPIDSDNNGVNDMLLFDMDGDGINDLALVDENEDGEFDYMIGDMNNDGKTDLLVYDKDENGSFEYFLIDTDFDGRWDTSGVDTNGDLEPDVIFAYTEE